MIFTLQPRPLGDFGLDDVTVFNVVDESIISFMLEHLRGLRTDWRDEFPNKIIHSDAPDNRYKVRRNWFTGVVADVANLLDEGKITDLIKQLAAQQLIDRFTSEEFINRDLTTTEDIQTANSLIDIILGK